MIGKLSPLLPMNELFPLSTASCITRFAPSTLPLWDQAPHDHCIHHLGTTHTEDCQKTHAYNTNWDPKLNKAGTACFRRASERLIHLPARRDQDLDVCADDELRSQAGSEALTNLTMTGIETHAAHCSPATRGTRLRPTARAGS